MTALEFLIWGTAIVVGYAVLSRGLFLATDGARQSLVDLAGTLIESRDISKEEKDEIRSLLETVHSSLCAWLMAFAVFFALVRLPFVRSPKQPTIPPMLRETHDSFTSRWIVATLGNSLIASTLFALLFLSGLPEGLPRCGFRYIILTGHSLRGAIPGLMIRDRGC